MGTALESCFVEFPECWVGFVHFYRVRLVFYLQRFLDVIVWCFLEDQALRSHCFSAVRVIGLYQGMGRWWLLCWPWMLFQRK